MLLLPHVGFVVQLQNSTKHGTLLGLAVCYINKLQCGRRNSDMLVQLQDQLVKWMGVYIYNICIRDINIDR